jgi:hypothetical protein
VDGAEVVAPRYAALMAAGLLGMLGIGGPII